MTFLKRLWNRQPQAEGAQSELTALDKFTRSAALSVSRRAFMKLLPGIGTVLSLGLPAVTASAEVGIEAFCWDEQRPGSHPCGSCAPNKKNVWQEKRTCCTYSDGHTSCTWWTVVGPAECKDC